jgi:phosphoglycerol geranylgeranyltransferase
MGRVLQYISDKLRRGPLHMTLIDPEKNGGGAAAEVAAAAVALGSDAIMLGGSTGISQEQMAETARAVKATVTVPTIIFPESPASITGSADAIYFMSLLNSRSVDHVIRMQARAALGIQRIGLEPLSLGYIIVAPGMRVGEVGQADPVPREDIELAQSYALAAEFLGMQLVYLEAGSGAPAPVPTKMVEGVRRTLHIPLIVGGGIRSGKEAGNLLSAGAQILVTGTVTEQEGIGPAFEAILSEVRRARGE